MVLRQPGLPKNQRTFLIKEARGRIIHYPDQTRLPGRYPPAAANETIIFWPFRRSRYARHDGDGHGGRQNLRIHYTGVDLERFHVLSPRRGGRQQGPWRKGAIGGEVWARCCARLTTCAIEEAMVGENTTLLIVGAGQERSRLASHPKPAA